MRLGSENIYEPQTVYCKKPGPGGPASLPMKNSLLRALCLVFLWAAAPFQAHADTGMVSFGESLSDVGNTVNLLTETEARVLTGYNSNFYFPNRYSNGYLWSDHLYTSLGFGKLGTCRATMELLSRMGQTLHGQPREAGPDRISA